MHSLEALARDASALANGETVLSAPETEVARQMQICNACRYCEGFCAVFPAMTRRLEFGKADIHFLANLCHNCGACLHACQYAPPHEFAVNVPQAMAQVRGQTYVDYAWPPALGGLYQRQGLTLSLALAAGLALFLVLAVVLQGQGLGALWSAPGSDFYGIFPHNLLVGLFAPVFLFATLALSLGVRRFWRDLTPATSGAPLSAPATAEAADAVLRLKYLDGGHGEGCHNEDDAYTLSRRRFHHLTFYGFLLCFAATSVATLYHYLLGQPAPYDLPSLPKLLGAVGGVSLALGTAGLWRLNLKRHPLHGDAAQKPMDRGFIALLFLTATSGLALWAARGTPALSLILCLHLGAVMALFATMPYGKFGHGIFRTAALLRHAVEKRLPNPVGLGAD
ncbi:MAG TPA: tricarballylate utilization protein TcuB [Hydrogenophaga sp.]|uniref:tricarballylate utilization 4Fe-4S protein TcuB n=1 Tax=Hydrogenophaga sp. TaxID=1904254 RepID=UPI0008B01A5E|nr:tricarballylate utilization 4Fe-4S protein TcuB [Hydrogenophaga sp.]OGA74300.1 MAG: tricarballylate utilization protein B [Burkholderiales bacterium GWE1_65_30]OGA89653.1 MAG: tricarballylate utilization protein B [Burkholderiales bacterium GWF1_66_17]HAX22702.1 tricarballylate utilization protein TcuB [Hydrogenophaga sp.]